MVKLIYLITTIAIIAILVLTQYDGLTSDTLNDENPKITGREASYSLQIEANNTTSYELIVPIPTGWKNMFLNLATITREDINTTIELAEIEGAPAISINGRGNLSISVSDKDYDYIINGFYGHYTRNNTFKIFAKKYPDESSLSIMMHYVTTWKLSGQRSSGNYKDGGITEIIISGDTYPPPKTPLEIRDNGWQWIKILEITS